MRRMPFADSRVLILASLGESGRVPDLLLAIVEHAPAVSSALHGVASGREK
jgi:hypothetical protein